MNTDRYGKHHTDSLLVQPWLDHHISSMLLKLMSNLDQFINAFPCTLHLTVGKSSENSNVDKPLLLTQGYTDPVVLYSQKQ